MKMAYLRVRHFCYPPPDRLLYILYILYIMYII